MQVPIQFPNDADVIREEVARFRALTPAEQRHELDEAFRAYHFLREHSERAAVIDRHAADEETATRRAIQTFAVHHA